jgi:hypothetical protein
LQTHFGHLLKSSKISCCCCCKFDSCRTDRTQNIFDLFLIQKKFFLPRLTW